MPQTRQLAAIMFTDIVGYTGLMGRDEQKAFELLQKNRALQKPIIEKFNGRWIKELGDGVMASFNAVSDAVAAAIEIQEVCNRANDFQLRIGIHLGEVVFENDDVFGDGVNIASRIQAIANPGSIYISESIYKSISNKKDFQVKYVKEEKLKNVKEKVKIFQVISDGIIIAHPPKIDLKIKSKPKFLFIFGTLIALLIAGYFINRFYIARHDYKNSNRGRPESIGKSIAVLPFVNMSADSSQEYFSDGMTESIITDLAQVPGLLVIARNSVFQYKGQAVDPVEVGNQLNVHYILQGRVQHSGDILRITVQLIETGKGFNVWGNKFDSRLKNIFMIQDDISKNIIQALKIAIAKEDSIVKPPTQNLEAYDYYLRGYYYFRMKSGTEKNLVDSSIAMFEKAVSLDPDFALAYAALAKAYVYIFFAFNADPKWETKGYIALEKALSLDPGLADAYVAKGNLTWTLSNGFPHEKAINEFKHAIALNPNLAEAHEALAAVYFHIGLLDEALREFRIALTIDPASRFSRPRVARIHWYQQKYDSALIEFSAINQPEWGKEKALVQWYLGRTDEAFKTLDELATQKSNSSTQQADLAAANAVLLAGVGRKKEAEEQIQIAIQFGHGLSHFHHAEHLIASSYALMGNSKAAVEWLKKAAEHGFPCYPLFNKDPNLKNIRNDPAFISFMQQLKKQWESYKSSL
jgi:TolB-like protein/Flp pilus assembly protein TadD